jgi:hypothetical protein
MQLALPRSPVPPGEVGLRAVPIPGVSGIASVIAGGSEFVAWDPA